VAAQRREGTLHVHACVHAHTGIHVYVTHACVHTHTHTHTHTHVYMYMLCTCMHSCTHTHVHATHNVQRDGDVARMHKSARHYEGVRCAARYTQHAQHERAPCHKVVKVDNRRHTISHFNENAAEAHRSNSNLPSNLTRSRMKCSGSTMLSTLAHCFTAAAHVVPSSMRAQLMTCS
jgi:hypothetical protein